MGKLDAQLTSNNISSTLSSGGDVGASSLGQAKYPAIEDYFEWRQETFTPTYQWPLDEPDGSTTISEYGGGPGGIVDGALTLGEDSLIRPSTKYSSAQNTAVYGGINLGTGTGDHIHNTGIFTIVMWTFQDSPGGYQTIISNLTRLGGGNAGFSVHTRGDNLISPYVVTDEGTVKLFENSFWRSTPEEDGRDLTQHLVFMCDGSTFYMYRNGMMVQSIAWPTNVKVGTPTYPMCLMQSGAQEASRWFRGRLQGVIIDDKPWSLWEIQADYERGLSATEVGVPLEPEIDGMILDLDATEFDKDVAGATVSNWNDGTAVQTDVTRQPYTKRFQGFLGVQFDGSEWLELPDLQMEPEDEFSIYIVCRRGANDNTGVFGTGTSIRINNVNGGRVSVGVGDQTTPSSPVGSFSGLVMLAVRSEGAGGQFRVEINGSILLERVVGVGANDTEIPATLGVQLDSDGNPGLPVENILMHEVRIFNRELTDAEDGALREYFDIKWGI